MSRLPELRRDELSPEAQSVWDAITSTPGRSQLTPGGGLAGPFNALLYAPDAGGKLAAAGAALRYGTSLEPRLRELAVITTGATWKAEFEWWAHARTAREQGVPATVVEAIGADQHPSFQAEDERIVYEIARAVTGLGHVPQRTYDQGVALLGEAGMVELIMLCGYYTTMSFLLNAFDVPLPPGSARNWPPPGE